MGPPIFLFRMLPPTPRCVIYSVNAETRVLTAGMPLAEKNHRIGNLYDTCEKNDIA